MAASLLKGTGGLAAAAAAVDNSLITENENENEQRAVFDIFDQLSDDQRLNFQRLLRDKYPTPSGKKRPRLGASFDSTPSKSPQQNTMKQKGNAPDVIFLHHNIPKTILNNPIKLAEQIEKAKPDATIAEIKIKGSGEIIIFPKEHSDYGKMMKKDSWKLTDYGPVTPSPPTAKSIPQVVVIKNVHPDVSIEDISTGLKTREIHPSEVIRMKRSSDGISTKSVKVILHSQQQKSRLLSEGFPFLYQVYKCVEYKKPPTVLQCYKCQKYGHGIGQCGAENPTCLRCGSAHWKNECQVERESAKCANCTQNHPSSFRGCAAYKDALKKFGPKTPSTSMAQKPNPSSLWSHHDQHPQQQNLNQSISTTATVTSASPPLPLLLTTIADALESILNHVGLQKQVEFSLISQCLAISCKKIMKITVPSQQMHEIKSRNNSRPTASTAPPINSPSLNGKMSDANLPLVTKLYSANASQYQANSNLHLLQSPLSTSFDPPLPSWGQAQILQQIHPEITSSPGRGRKSSNLSLNKSSSRGASLPIPQPNHGC
jgi:hypothetical protein